MVGTNHAPATTVNTTDEPCLKVAVNQSCYGFRCDAPRHDDGVGKHTPLSVDPSSFVLHGVDDDVVKPSKDHVIEHVLNARPVVLCKRRPHLLQCCALDVGKRGVIAHSERSRARTVAKKPCGCCASQAKFHVRKAAYEGHTKVDVSEGIQHSCRCKVEFVDGDNEGEEAGTKMNGQ